MKPVSEMSVAEMIEEARRRDERRREGKPLAPDPVELQKRIEEIDARLEKAIQLDVMKVYKGFSCKVYNLSQPRATKQTPGLPDLYVRPPRRIKYRSFWHETKTPSGVQSDDQLQFQMDCVAEGTDYVLGGVLAAEEQCIKLGLAERVNGILEHARR
jgi:hypothetical protein